jgi:hypothetical protein
MRVSVLAQDEIPTIDAVVDETIRLRTGIRERMFSVVLAVPEALIRLHLRVMLVTKRAKFLARLGSRHRPFSGTLPNKLSWETVYQGNRLVPFDFRVLSQVRSYAGGIQVSSVHIPRQYRNWTG